MTSDSEPITKSQFEKLMKKPLVKYSDMPMEMGQAAVEVVTMSLDKNGKNYEAASQLVKNTMDKKFGPAWQCAIGEGFGFDISCQRKYLLHVYYSGAGILCYKC